MKLALCVLKLHVKHMHIYQCGSIFLQDGYVFAFIIIVVLFLCLVRPPLWAIYKLKSILCTARIFLTGEQEAAQARCLTPPGGTDQTRSS